MKFVYITTGVSNKLWSGIHEYVFVFGKIIRKINSSEVLNAWTML